MSAFPLSSRLQSERGEAESGSASLEEMLKAVVEKGRDAHPKLTIDAGEFIGFIGARLEGTSELEAELERLHIADLYLACACALGQKGAAERLEEVHIPAIGRAVSRIDSSPSFGADVTQRVREKLLVGGRDVRPKISDYAGRGSLTAWLNVTAVRTALNLKASTRVHKPLESDVVHDALVDSGFEAGIVRSKYTGAFKEAMAVAIASLPSRDRTALRLRFIDGLSIDTIGELYDVHRATVARWIASARTHVRDKTIAELKSNLDLSHSEVESVLRILELRDVVTTGLLDCESD